VRQAEVNRNRRSSEEHSGPRIEHGTWAERRNPLDSAPSFASVSLQEWHQREGNEVRASTSEGRQEMEHREQSWLGASESEARPSERASGRKGGAASWRVGSENEGRESDRLSESKSRRASEGEKSHREQSWLRTSVHGARASERECENESRRESEGEKSHRKQSWLRASNEAWASEDKIRVSECVSKKISDTESVPEKDHKDQGWRRISQDEGGPQAGPVSNEVAERVSKNPERLRTRFSGNSLDGDRTADEEAGVGRGARPQQNGGRGYERSEKAVLVGAGGQDSNSRGGRLTDGDGFGHKDAKDADKHRNISDSRRGRLDSGNWEAVRDVASESNGASEPGVSDREFSNGGRLQTEGLRGGRSDREASGRESSNRGISYTEESGRWRSDRGHSDTEDRGASQIQARDGRANGGSLERGGLSRGVLLTEDLARDRSETGFWEERPSKRGASEAGGWERGFLEGGSAVQVGRNSERAPELRENGKQSQAFPTFLKRSLHSEVRRGGAYRRNSLSEVELNNRRTVKQDVRRWSDPSMRRDAFERIHTTEVLAEKSNGKAYPEDDPAEIKLGVNRIGSPADGFRGFEREVDKLRLAEGEPSWTSAEPSGSFGRAQSSRPKGGSRGALAGAHGKHPRSAERARASEGAAAEFNEMEGITGPRGGRGSVLVEESAQLRSRRSSVGGSTTRAFFQEDTWSVADGQPDAGHSPAVSAVNSRPWSRASGAGLAGKDNETVAGKTSGHRLSGDGLSENRLSGDVGSDSQASQRIRTGGQVSEEMPARMSVSRIALKEQVAGGGTDSDTPKGVRMSPAGRRNADALKAGRKTSAEFVLRAGGPASAADGSTDIADVPRKRAASMAGRLRTKSPLGLRIGSTLQVMQRGHSMSAGAGEIWRKKMKIGMENGVAGGFEGLGSALADFLQKESVKDVAKHRAGRMDKGLHGTADAGGGENLGSAVAEFLMKQNGMGAGGKEMERPRNPGMRAKRDGGLEALGSAFAKDERRRLEPERSGDRSGSNESLNSGSAESLKSQSEGGGAGRERRSAARKGSIESLGFAVAEFLTNQSGEGEAKRESAVRDGSVESLGSAVADFLTKRSKGGEGKRERGSAVRNGSIESLGSAIAEFLSGQNEEVEGEGEQRLKSRVQNERFKAHHSSGTSCVEFLRSKCPEGTETEQNGTILAEQKGSSESSRQRTALTGDSSPAREPDERSLEGRPNPDRPSVDLAKGKGSCSRLSSVSFRGKGDGKCQAGGLSDGRMSFQRVYVENDDAQDTKSGRLPVSALVLYPGPIQQVLGQPVRI
jgi:hypothetical protein